MAIDGWEEFKVKYQRPINNLKSRLEITLYGSYSPKRDKTLLLDLKRILIGNGYPRASIVEDRQSMGEDPLEISQNCMLFSDLNLLIFTRTGMKHGLIDELTFLTSDRMSEKIRFSMIFDQVQGEKGSLPPLSKSRVNIYGIQRREFKTSRQLKDLIVKHTYWLMRGWAYAHPDQV